MKSLFFRFLLIFSLSSFVFSKPVFSLEIDPKLQTKLKKSKTKKDYSVNFFSQYSKTLDKNQYGYWSNFINFDYKIKNKLNLQSHFKYISIQSKYKNTILNLPYNFFGNPIFKLQAGPWPLISPTYTFKLSGFLEPGLSILSKREGFRRAANIKITLEHQVSHLLINLQTSYKKKYYKFDTKDNFGMIPSENQSLIFTLALESLWPYPLKIRMKNSLIGQTYYTKTYDRLYRRSLSLIYNEIPLWGFKTKFLQRDLRSSGNLVQQNILSFNINYQLKKKWNLNLMMNFPDHRFTNDQIKFQAEDSEFSLGCSLQI